MTPIWKWFAFILIMNWPWFNLDFNCAREDAPNFLYPLCIFLSHLLAPWFVVTALFTLLIKELSHGPNKKLNKRSDVITSLKGNKILSQKVTKSKSLVLKCLLCLLLYVCLFSKILFIYFFYYHIQKYQHHLFSLRLPEDNRWLD